MLHTDEEMEDVVRLSAGVLFGGDAAELDTFLWREVKGGGLAVR